MSYQEALAYLNSFVNYEKQDRYDYKKLFKLDRMVKLAALLGNPEAGIKSIHVAGTKGKGSTSAMIHSILKSAGFKAGLYTSPHLTTFRERIRVDDELISEDDISRILDTVKDAVEALGDDRPSFFEVYTALAYLYFKERSPDFVVYEVGLGGRLDATNIITPLISVITPLSYEHMDKLGHTLTQIAVEKCGIIKERSICVSAEQHPEAREVIKKTCEEKKTRLIELGKDVMFKEIGSSESKEIFSVRGLFNTYPRLETPLLGAHQAANAACSIAVIEALRYHDITIDADAVSSGLRDVKWPGRLEILSRNPMIAIDGAQNGASAHVLAEAVKGIFKYDKLTLILGVSKDKDISGILKELVPIADSMILTKSKISERALEPSHIKEERILCNMKVALTESVEEAVDKALSGSSPEDMILIAGSLFVAGEARSYILDTLGRQAVNA